MHPQRRWSARRGRPRGAGRAARAVLAAGAACAVGLAACGGAASGTPGSTRSGGSASSTTTYRPGTGIGSVHRSGTVPLDVIHSQGATLAVVEVSIAGHGPFPFIVDTGAARSVVDKAVARSVGLHVQSATTPVAGVGCTTTAHPSQVTTWKAGAFRLPADRVSVLSLASGSAIGGLLGSDVLSRFGEVALSYSGQRLELGHAAVQLGSAPVARIPVDVVQRRGAVAALAPVHVGHRGPFPFVVDTGAARSAVATSLAHRLQLHAVGSAVRGSGVACQVRAAPVRVAHWRVGSLVLPASRPVSVTLPGSDQGHGIDGLLGSSTLSRFGTVAIDYRSGSLLVPGG